MDYNSKSIVAMTTNLTFGILGSNTIQSCLHIKSVELKFCAWCLDGRGKITTKHKSQKRIGR
jgi:sulfur relay (sulfurtransferase) complex TusBCD TusD component (DsrE family)